MYGLKMYVGTELLYAASGPPKEAVDSDAITFEAFYRRTHSPIPIGIAERLLHDNFPNLTWTRQPVSADHMDDEGDLAWSSSDPSITAYEESNGTVHLAWGLNIEIKLTPESLLSGYKFHSISWL